MFNSHLKLFPGKLRSRWSCPFIVIVVFSHGVIEVVSQDHLMKLKINGQRLKSYWRGDNSNEKIIMPFDSTV